jgi:hypothetical protein
MHAVLLLIKLGPGAEGLRVGGTLTPETSVQSNTCKHPSFISLLNTDYIMPRRSLLMLTIMSWPDSLSTGIMARQME